MHWPLLYQAGHGLSLRQQRYAGGVQGDRCHAPGRKITVGHLFQRLGICTHLAETDWQGDYILSSQVWTTAADLARFGQLYSNDGVLPSGERILPEGWVEYVSAPAGPQPEGTDVRLWRGLVAARMQARGHSAPIPIAAMGNRGQYVVVVPSRDVVIVRRGEDPAGQGGFDIAAFTRDVLAALKD